MSSRSLRIRDLGYSPGELPPGPNNSILDVPGVHVSQITVPTSSTLKPGSTASKGVTIISPRPPKEFYKPCRAGTFCFNGNGEITGSRQIADWGFTNTPIAFTNSTSLGTVFDGIWDWVLEKGEELGWDDDMSGRQFGTPVTDRSRKTSSVLNRH
jgi:D-aminopeptidase